MRLTKGIVYFTKKLTIPTNSFFMTTIILMRFGFIQGVALWVKDMVAVIFSAQP